MKNSPYEYTTAIFHQLQQFHFECVLAIAIHTIFQAYNIEDSYHKTKAYDQFSPRSRHHYLWFKPGDGSIVIVITVVVLQKVINSGKDGLK